MRRGQRQPTTGKLIALLAGWLVLTALQAAEPTLPQKGSAPEDRVFADGFELLPEGGGDDDDDGEAPDLLAPQLAISEPLPDAWLRDPRPPIRLDYSDAGSGVDTASLQLRVADIVLDAGCTANAVQALCIPTAALPDGEIPLTASLRDLAGNLAQAGPRSFHIDTVPPAPLAADAVSASAIENGEVTLTALAGAVEAGDEVAIAAPALPEEAIVVPDGNGGFVAIVPLEPGDSIDLRVRDRAGNRSAPLRLTPGLPPDPQSVAPPLPDGGAGDFLEPIGFIFEGPTPIQIGLQPGALQPEHAVLLRGTVFDGDGAPLPGARVTLKDGDPFGYTLSRADGQFDFVANGGGRLVMEFRKAGYLPAQRQVEAPWNDYLVVPEVALVALDPLVTAIELGADAGQIAEGTQHTDADGTRRASVYFPPGLQAQYYDHDGQLQPLSELDVRFTEFTVGENGPRRMPAPLPPASAYTYAVEISVDQALQNGRKVAGKDVIFDRPVALHVDNFLDYPVGEGVPTGYYDADAVAWKAEPDGRIVGVLAIENGRAVLDLDGQGLAATAEQLAAWGIDDDERVLLAQRFAVGASFWRVRLAHFSRYDCNWPYRVPLEAISPVVEFKQDDGELPEDGCETGCLIGQRTQTLHEQVAIPGLPGGAMGYSSHNAVPVLENGPALELRLTPSEVPPSLHAVVLELELLGRKHVSIHPGVPNYQVRLPLQLLDPYFRSREGSYPIKLRVGYQYRAVPAASISAGGGGSGGSGGFGSGGGGVWISADRSRILVTLWRQWQKRVTYASAQRTRKTGAWRLPWQHVLDPQSRTLYLGGGKRVEALEHPESVRTLAGGAQSGSAAEQAPAIGASLNQPGGIAFDAIGRLYIADRNNHRVRRVLIDGRIETVAGSGAPGSAGDGGPATQAQLSSPMDVSIGPDGTLYIADTGNHRIRAVTVEGEIRTVAGTGVAGLSQDGLPGPASQFNAPQGVDADDFGYLHIADTGNDRVRSLRPDGSVVTLAGGGNGQGDLAIHAQVSSPTDLASDADGNVYFLEATQRRIRRVAADGRIAPYAGTGSPAYNGDGVSATLANLGATALAVDRSGRVLIADTLNHRVRVIDANGKIATLAGDGSNVYPADGVAALKTGVSSPRAVAVDPRGQVVFVQAHAVRRLARSFVDSADPDEIVVPDPSGESVHVFDLDGRHRRTVDALTGGVLYTLQYDSTGVISMTDAYGNLTRLERDGLGRPTALISADDLRTELTLNADGVISAVQTPAGHVTQFGYDGDGLLLWMRNARNQQWNYAYHQGRLIQDNRPDGSGWDLVRRDGGAWHEVDFTSRLGRTTTHHQAYLPDGSDERSTAYPDDTLSLRRFSPTGDEYALGRDGTQVITTKQADPRFGPSVAHPERVEITTPAGLTAILESELSVTPPGISDPAQLLEWQETTTLNGRESSLHFDAATRVFTTTSAAGRSAQMTVDAQRRPLHLASAGLAEVDYSYDPRGRLIGITQSDGLTTRAYQFGYDANGYLDQVTDPLNRTVQIENDLDGRPTLLTLPDNREIALTSDENGNVTTLTTPKQDVHIFGYDPLDRENRYEAPNLGTPTVTETDYDLEGNVEQQRLPGGISLNFGYDAGGRLTAVSRPEQDGDAGNDVELTYAYDGFLTTQETASGTIEGRIGYGYDADFRIEELTVSEAAPAAPATTVDYDYDPDGLLIEAQSTPDPVLGPATSLTLTRDPQHGLLTGTHAGAVEDAWTWNAYAEPSAYSASINAAPILELSYERDLLGRITRKTETIQGVTTETDYTYDLAGRLQRVEIGGALEEEYVYDANGNRLTLTPGQGNPIAATYDAQDRLLTHGNCTFTYTANGELKTKTCGADTTHYTYTALGDLTAVEQPDGTLIEYVVDGRGRRVGKRVDGNLVQGFLYLNQLEPSAELDQNGAIVATFVYADKVHVPSLMHKGGKTYRYLTDHLGSPRLIVDTATGDIAQRIDYDAWGNVTLDTNPGFQPFGFAGGIYDRDIGLVRFGVRDYDSMTGRWTTKDPIQFNGGDANLYAYVYGNPVNWTDVRGLACDQRGCWNTAEELLAAQASDWSGYYNLACAAGDPYACRAGEVAANMGEGLRGVLSEITNRKLAASIAKNQIATCPSSARTEDLLNKMEAIRISLMNARVRQLLGAESSSPRQVDRRDIADFHHDVFEANGADRDAFGGDAWDSLNLTPVTGYNWCPSPACRN